MIKEVNKPKCSDRGFTLLEVVIAFGIILSISITAGWAYRQVAQAISIRERAYAETTEEMNRIETELAKPYADIESNELVFVEVIDAGLKRVTCGDFSTLIYETK